MYNTVFDCRGSVLASDSGRGYEDRHRPGPDDQRRKSDELKDDIYLI